MALDIHALSIRDPKVVCDNVDKVIARRKLDQEIYLTILSRLYDFRGKKITRKIETALQKESSLFSLHVVYKYEGSMYQILIWSKNNGIIEYSNRFSLLLGYKENPVVDIEWIKENNKRYSYGFEQIQKLEEFKTVAESTCDMWNSCVKQLEDIEKGLKGYGVQYIF